LKEKKKESMENRVGDEQEKKITGSGEWMGWVGCVKGGYYHFILSHDFLSSSDCHKCGRDYERDREEGQKGWTDCNK
jgi:hypothetical protein